MNCSEPQPLVSVIIPTRNRVRLLEEVIRSLWIQTLPPSAYEIIVIDNCSTDGTPEMMQRLAAEAPCRLVYRKLEENRGPAAARNLAAHLAGADILAFTDSDCRAHPEWLARAVAAFQESPKIALVSGAVVDKPGQPVKFFSLRNGAGPDENYMYPACNVFYRRDAFLELGCFDESAYFYDIRNSPIECTDTDFAWKLQGAGYGHRYVPEAIIYHEVARTTPLNWLLYHIRILVIPELVRRHPGMRAKVLHAGIFYSDHNAFFYLAVLGCVLGLLVHWAFLALAIPYVVWAATVAGGRITFMRIPRILARILCFAMMHVVVSGSLIYGSARSRTLVL
jgi:glycosyltransferase involved in cell wall biosynthesis